MVEEEEEIVEGDVAKVKARVMLSRVRRCALEPRCCGPLPGWRCCRYSRLQRCCCGAATPCRNCPLPCLAIDDAAPLTPAPPPPPAPAAEPPDRGGAGPEGQGCQGLHALLPGAQVGCSPAGVAAEALPLLPGRAAPTSTAVCVRHAAPLPSCTRADNPTAPHLASPRLAPACLPLQGRDLVAAAGRPCRQLAPLCQQGVAQGRRGGCL